MEANGHHTLAGLGEKGPPFTPAISHLLPLRWDEWGHTPMDCVWLPWLCQNPHRNPNFWSH